MAALVLGIPDHGMLGEQLDEGTHDGRPYVPHVRGFRLPGTGETADET